MDFVLRTDISLIVIQVVGVVAILAGFVAAVLYQWYHRCKSNEILVIFGNGLGKGRTHRCIHGGGAFVWPFIQNHAYLSLVPFKVEFPNAEFLSSDQIGIRISGEAQVAIGTGSAQMDAAAERLLGLDERSIKNNAADALQSALQELFASITGELAIRDREKVIHGLHDGYSSKLNPYGLEIVNLNSGFVQDSAGIAEGIEREAAMRAIARAQLEVEEEDRIRKEEAAKFAAERRTPQESAPAIGKTSLEQSDMKSPADILKEDHGDTLKNM